MLNIDKYLDAIIKSNATDLYLTVSCEPSIRKEEKIIKLNHPPLSSEEINLITKEIITEEQSEEFSSTLELNMSITWQKKYRFRFNFFKQQNHIGIIIRHIKTIIPTIEELKLPAIYSSSVLKKQGLILLSSPSGSGKSTSMAAMVNFRNTFGTGHILTIEDPIEFVHHHNTCIVTQREVGTDTYSYGMALRNALRQRADVIVIGEIRDRDAMEHAIRFAETGHLCISTLHATNTTQAIDRIANFFPDEARKHILMTLSHNLISIFSQKLITDRNNKRVLGIEILLNQGLVKTLVQDDRINEIKETIAKNKNAGMQTIDQAILDLYLNEIITLETALAEAENPSNLKLLINQSSKSNISDSAKFNGSLLGGSEHVEEF